MMKTFLCAFFDEEATTYHKSVIKTMLYDYEPHSIYNVLSNYGFIVITVVGVVRQFCLVATDHIIGLIIVITAATNKHPAPSHQPLPFTTPPNLVQISSFCNLFFTLVFAPTVCQVKWCRTSGQSTICLRTRFHFG